jgi:membrane-bound serine protease (ClpP class)
VYFKGGETLKRSIVIIFITLLCLFPFAIAIHGNSEEKEPVFLIEVDGIINPATAKFITDSIDQASKEGGQCLIIQLDTPGGLMESMRIIIKKMLSSTIPIIVYVAPSGSRAASAGVFIT